jgi:hypothetical protein
MLAFIKRSLINFGRKQLFQAGFVLLGRYQSSVISYLEGPISSYISRINEKSLHEFGVDDSIAIAIKDKPSSFSKAIAVISVLTLVNFSGALLEKLLEYWKK